MPEIEFVSLIRLIQVPEKYHGARVRVVGYSAVEFEHKALYVSPDDVRNAVTKNGLWLDLPINEETKKLSGKYLLVEATFDKDNKGHLRMFSGCLAGVTRAEVWSEGRDPEKAPARS
ncbi:MAG: hypothetical protein HY900_16210 [Deltaproteobacteria bacterium]|nr:hypothetical protein [Deltaproteobacteria bacterium]